MIEIMPDRRKRHAKIEAALFGLFYLLVIGALFWAFFHQL